MRSEGRGLLVPEGSNELVNPGRVEHSRHSSRVSIVQTHFQS